MLLFGSEQAASGVFYNGPLFTLLVIILTVFIFLKFCGWAKKRTMPAGTKKGIFILTALGAVAFNVMYSLGNSAFEQGQGLNMATIAVVSALLWVFVFSYALMSETK
ncbi:MAG TPA: hypothetical protein DER60_02685 [Syntrophomonas sp.]|jgi:uncharacterized membrane protein YeaQ/YmgE (transglycosylase-associated protein family)|nr:hypothetical protein [Syntrophomonas sp.]